MVHIGKDSLFVGPSVGSAYDFLRMRIGSRWVPCRCLSSAGRLERRHVHDLGKPAGWPGALGVAFERSVNSKP